MTVVFIYLLRETKFYLSCVCHYIHRMLGIKLQLKTCEIDIEQASLLVRSNRNSDLIVIYECVTIGIQIMNALLVFNQVSFLIISGYSPYY